ncbi:MAG: DUF4011 domain-containing protein, partial [Mycoplasma sp.]
MAKSKIKNKLLITTNLDPAINTKNRAGALIDLFLVTNPKELEKFLWSNKEELIVTGNNYNEIKDELNRCSSSDEFINVCENYDISLTKTNITNLNAKFKINKEKMIETIVKKQLSFAKTFAAINSKAKKIQQEENIYTLYVSSYFLNGQDINNTSINAPLLLWEVSISLKGGDIKIIKNQDEPTVNEKINFYLNANYNIDVGIENDTSDIKMMKKYADIFNKMSIDNNFDGKMEKYINSENTKLKITNAICLMLVEPLGGAIKKDIELIESRKQDPFKINNEIIDYNKYRENTIKDDYIIDFNRPLNIYQKYAVKTSLERNTLIYGPPGTGKSETISTIIANIIYSKKSILMVSEKMAALEVLEKRLGALSQAALFAFKPEHKEKFYAALQSVSDSLHKNIKYDPNAIKDNQEKVNIAYQRLIKQLNAIMGIERDLSVASYTNILFTILNDGEIEQVVNAEQTMFHKLMKIWKSDYQKIITNFDDIKILWSIARNEPDAFKVLTKNRFHAKNQEIIEFMKYFSNHDESKWLIKNFIKNKKNYQKEPLLKLKVKHESSIIRALESLQSLSNNSIKVNDFSFLKSIPPLLVEKDNFEKYISYNFLKDKFDKNNYEQLSTLQSLNKEYLNLKKQISKDNDKLIFNQYIDTLKTHINNLKDEQLKTDIFEVLSKVSLKRKPAINALIRKYYWALRTLFPIWVLNPNQTAILNPCDKNIFDYGIFDEASQMFLERAYPLVYRCKTNIVAGDDKQLQPTSFFLKRVDDEEDVSDSLGTSLFEQANICMWAKFHLKNHYRSDSSELISFSNEYVYENNLEFATRNGITTKPIIVHNVKGTWENRMNEEEINKILSILKDKQYDSKTILIVTFNIKQATYLENYFTDEFYGTKTYDKFNDGKISIRSLENVQGDEADVVILSISYGPDKTGKVSNFFG